MTTTGRALYSELLELAENDQLRQIEENATSTAIPVVVIEPTTTMDLLPECNSPKKKSLENSSTCLRCLEKEQRQIKWVRPSTLK